MSRQHTSFEYTNGDGVEGFVRAEWGSFSAETSYQEGPFALMFDDAPWMGIDDAERFLDWLAETLLKARGVEGPPPPGVPPQLEGADLADVTSLPDAWGIPIIIVHDDSTQPSWPARVRARLRQMGGARRRNA